MSNLALIFQQLGKGDGIIYPQSLSGRVAQRENGLYQGHVARVCGCDPVQGGVTEEPGILLAV